MPCNLGALIPGSLCAKLGAAGPPPGTFGSLADPTQSIMTECYLFVSRAPGGQGLPGCRAREHGFWSHLGFPLTLGKLLMLFQHQFFFFRRGIC